MSTPQSRPRIAIDLDGVLTEHPAPLAAAANQRFRLDLPDRAFIDSAGLSVPMHVREWVYGDDGPASRLRPASGAHEFIDDVIGVFGIDNVMILTARPDSAAQMTLGWLSRHDFPDIQVKFADDKLTLARDEGCGWSVEDSERHALNYAAGGITCFLITGVPAIPLHADEPLIVEVESLADIPARLRILTASEERRLAIAASLPPVDLDAGTPRPRIVVSDAIHPVAREELSASADLIDVDGTDRAALLAAIAGADALVVRSETLVTPDVIAAAPRLRVVARAGVGVDNIDLDAATRAGVVVLNAPGANATSAGEHTVAVLLALTRQIPHANESTHAGRWERRKIKPIDLRNRTVGLVGLGRVGSVVARRLRAFEMRVIAHDPYVPTSRFHDLGVESVSLDTLYATADVVSFHVPSTPETWHMLNQATIARLRDGAIVLNMARGDVVDQDALAEALRSGKVAAAGVDVFHTEPCIDSPLFGLPNVIVTPHTAGSSYEALEAVGRVIASSTLAALRGEAVPNAVNLPAATLDAPELRRLTSVAGAAGHLLSVLVPELPHEVRLSVHGPIAIDIAEHVLNAALCTSLQQWLGRRVTPVNARMVAESIGVVVQPPIVADDAAPLPQFVFQVRGTTSHTVTVTWDRVHAGIVAVDRFSLERPLAGHVLITHHRDQPGVIGTLGTILANYGVNIAGMQVGRHAPRREAMMVTNVDEAIPEGALAEIRAAPAIDDAFIVSLPPFDGDPDPVAIQAMTAAAAR
ncbi:MAG TPA: phosphoglycerate dehydrogenase [Thermomicrobiales bacterium]|nr:phosphoglycerate dehydrogenase [Thermomicrobiales bacterium]